MHHIFGDWFGFHLLLLVVALRHWATGSEPYGEPGWSTKFTTAVSCLDSVVHSTWALSAFHSMAVMPPSTLSRTPGSWMDVHDLYTSSLLSWLLALAFLFLLFRAEMAAPVTVLLLTGNPVWFFLFPSAHYLPALSWQHFQSVIHCPAAKVQTDLLSVVQFSWRRRCWLKWQRTESPG